MGAWPAMKPDDDYLHNWHIDAICEHLEAVTRGEITRLQVWVPPVSMKTLLVSVMWPAWEWTHSPKTRYWSASYSEPLSGIIASWSRGLILSDWYQAALGRQVFRSSASRCFSFPTTEEEPALRPVRREREQGSTVIEYSLMTRSNRMTLLRLLEPPWKSRTSGGTPRVSSRGIGNDFARVIVMQRLHENDLCGHTLAKEHYEVLCLPERYESKPPLRLVEGPQIRGRPPLARVS